MLGMVCYKRARRLTRDEERTFCTAARAGDTTARDRLVESCYPWALMLADRYAKHGLDRDEAISAAHLGLLKAVERLDPDRGRLITAAGWWIRAEMSRLLREKKKHIFVSSLSQVDRHEWERREPRAMEQRDEVETKDSFAPVRRRIGRLTPAEQRAVRGALTGKTLQYIADEHGISLSAVRLGWRRGIKKLRKWLENAKVEAC